ncbi:MAG: GNAT family N-acetyltransferase [Sphingomonadaceae bacterium]|nr:GNAT family N-acetyltransferase [Sphingomonadaceae bacterium]
MADFRHETARLVLRDWQDGDWEPFWRHTNTPAVMQWLGGVCDDAKKEAAQARILSYRRDHGFTFWAVERKEDKALIGFCGLKRSNQAGGPQGMMEVGWRLREDAWGHGYAREAASAALDLAFGQFGAEDVIALTVQGNAPSWGLMLRLGMERREDLDFDNDEFDVETGRIIVYSISQRDWHRGAA